MLLVTYQALQPKQKQEKLNLLVQEIDVIRNNYNTVNTAAALLAGFAFSGVTGLDLGPQATSGLEVAFYIGSTLVMTLSLHAVIVSTIANVSAQDLTWRGGTSDESVPRALQALNRARHHVYLPFAISVVLFQFGLAIVTCSRLGFNDTSLRIGTLIVFALYLGLFGFTIWTWKVLRPKFFKMSEQTGFVPQTGH
eukprot:TRINITY_DN9517_c0_g1_i1.p1 TRINITY_DN9517_c0_g1~~TRINITY_DN9517_c0_g1_i1.p1  ORF type:complete len:195 (+),score=62.31 TRINITY_DN9517_c0_g1_i1:81-665(+)